MVGSHVAHDCTVGNDVIFANAATLAGHCIVEDHVFLSGLVAVHQFVRIGRGAMLAGGSVVLNDVIPFATTVGAPARLVGINVVGLRRRKCPTASIRAVRLAYRMLFLRPGIIAERIAETERALGSDPYVATMLDFLKSPRRRHLSRPGRARLDVVRSPEE
jgi:UDP-N-acetylglucosamine acyltransferase